MPTNGQPRLKKKTVGSLNLYPISGEDFKELEELLHLKIPDKEREQIQEASRQYLMFCKVFQDKVLWRDSKAALKEIKKRAEPFLKIFEGIDSTTVDMLISAGQQSQNTHIVQLLIDDHEETVTRIRSLIQAAQDVLKNRKGDKKRPIDRTPVRQFAYDLKPIYKTLTGNNATCTPPHPDYNTPPSKFITFVDSCLKIILTEKGYQQDGLTLQTVSKCVASIIKK